MLTRISAPLGAVLFLASSAFVAAQDVPTLGQTMDHAKMTAETQVAAATASPVSGAYPLTTCIVSGDELGSKGDPVVMMHEGREIHLCSDSCVEAFQADSAGLLVKLDAAITAAQSKDYPLHTCMVSGKEFAPDAAVSLVVGNRLFLLCCPDCQSAVKGDAAKFGAMLDAAVVERDKAAYPLDTCVVSGDKLGEMGNPVEFVYNNRLVRFCCDGCIDTFKASPAKYMAAIDAAKGAAAGTVETTN